MQSSVFTATAITFDPNFSMISISDSTEGIAPQCSSLSKYFLFGANNKTTCLALPEINNSIPQGPLGFLS